MDVDHDHCKSTERVAWFIYRDDLKGSFLKGAASLFKPKLTVTYCALVDKEKFRLILPGLSE